MTRPQPIRPQSPVERFFLPQPLQLATAEMATAELAGTEAHHLLHVLRAKVGDRVGLFNGQGNEALCEIVKVGKRSAELRVIDRWTTPLEPRELVIATALPKGDRADWLIEKATELGVTRLIPLRTERSVVEPRESKLQRLEQIAVAACKQCGRSRLPRIDPLTSLSDLLCDVSATPSTHRLVLADPQATQCLGQLFESIGTAPRSVIALIGPEGGFTKEEQSAAIAAGGAPVRLGPHILRIETAALAFAAAWSLSCSNEQLAKTEPTETR